jgi:hypothetical protein
MTYRSLILITTFRSCRLIPFARVLWDLFQRVNAINHRSNLTRQEWHDMLRKQSCCCRFSSSERAAKRFHASLTLTHHYSNIQVSLCPGARTDKDQPALVA